MTGLRIKDSEGNIFTIKETSEAGLTLKGSAGEKEISSFDLLFYTIITE